jgi:hypothetical protein
MKVYYTSWHFQTPEIFLNYIRHMTPGRSGNWKDMIATTNKDEADFFVVFDGTNEKIDESRAIYFCQHPKVEGYDFNASPSFKSYENKKCLATFNSENSLNPGEWWLDYDYDTLMALKRPEKQDHLACIMTYQPQTNGMYAQRVKWLQAYAKHCTDKDLPLDVYGRPEERYREDEFIKNKFVSSLGHNKPDGTKGEHTTGKDVLLDYRYSLEFDVGPTKNYISERFYDALLLWTMPIYFGSNNVEQYLPSKAFHYVNILNLTHFDNIDRIVASNSREDNIEEIARAREMLLNDYQTFPFIYNKLKSL